MSKINKIKQFLDMVPRDLTSANEIYNFARNAYKQMMGFFPDGIDNIFLKRGAAEMQNLRDKTKVVQFPQGGKDKTDFFSTRPDPRVTQPKGAKTDVMRAHENLSGGSNYAKGDTKYNADVLADEIARQRKLIPDDGIADSSDLDFKTKTALYNEAYSYLTAFNRLNKPPGKGQIPVTIGGENKNMTAEDLMNELVKMTNKNVDDIKLGVAPKTKKTKEPVDPVLEKIEEKSKMFREFEERNKGGKLFNLSGQKGNFLTEDEFAKELDSSVANFVQNSPGFNLTLISDLKKAGAKAYNPYPDEIGDKFLTDDQRQRTLKALEDVMNNEEYQQRFANNFADLMEEGEDVIEFAPNTFKIDPPKRADGGRIGFGGGGLAGFAGNQMEQYSPGVNIPGSPQVPMGQIGPANVGIFGGGGYGKNQVVPGVDVATTNQNFGIAGQMPIGNTGFTLGGSYMKSRANERFTGPLIPGQVFKNVPTDSDRFNVGINFRKQFKDGSKPKSPGRRNFIKGMAGLAALPFVGKFFKPAAKVAEGGPAIAEGVKLGFDKFMMLVDKIKRLGRSADNLATQERQKVIRYEGKDGSEYELVEDLTTGDISVTKDRPGIAVYNRGQDDVEGIDVIEDRSTFYLKRNQADETTKGKKPPDEYDEMKLEAPDGETFDAVDDVDDRTINEILEELGETRTKKAGGGLAYMLGE